MSNNNNGDVAENKSKHTIKNSVKSISADISIFLVCFGVLVACPLRIFQMLKNMEPVTGFYENYGDITIVILYALLAVIAVVVLVLSFLSARIPADIPPKGRRIVLGIASIILAATFVYDAVGSYSGLSSSTATIVQNVKSVSALGHVHAIAALLSFFYFLVFGVSYLFGKAVYKKLKIFALAPLVWTIVKTLERLTIIISILRVSELLLELCALVFLMVFFLTFARVVSDVNSKGSMWSVISCGLVSSMFIITYSLPRLMLMITGNSASIVSGYELNYCDLACVLFIFVFVVTTLRCGYKAEDIEEMNKVVDEAVNADTQVQSIIDKPNRDITEDVSVSGKNSDDDTE